MKKKELDITLFRITKVQYVSEELSFSSPRTKRLNL